MKKRTFFATLILFTLFFNLSIFTVSVVTLKDNYSAVQNRCLAEHYIIATSLINDIQSIENRGMDPAANITQLMQSYTRYSQDKQMELCVSLKDTWIYQTSSTEPFPITEPPGTVPNTERQIFTDSSSPSKLCIYGRFPSPYQDYGLLYRYDLADMKQSWRQMKNFLFLAGLCATVILAGCLMYLLNVVFRPLNQIAASSRKIAAGEYGQRLPDSGSDEIAAMARSFNRMAQEIENQIAQLKQAARQKQEFIDNFAHELRTPLTAIYGYAEYIQKASISEQDKYTSTDFIMSQCRRLQNMAGQLLELALLRNDDIAMEPVSIDELFQKVYAEMEPKTLEFDVTLSLQNICSQDCCLHNRCLYNNCFHNSCLSNSGLRNSCFHNSASPTPSSPLKIQQPQITGNPGLLESLLCNLIDNALKASRPQGHIILSACAEDNYTVLCVSDDGIGMQPQQLAHITQAFYRADKARSRRLGGAGLGLSLCESIVSLHHAKMKFFSQPGEGTQLKIFFLQVDNNSETV